MPWIEIFEENIRCPTKVQNDCLFKNIIFGRHKLVKFSKFSKAEAAYLRLNIMQLCGLSVELNSQNSVLGEGLVINYCTEYGLFYQ